MASEEQAQFPLDVELQYHILKMMMRNDNFCIKSSVYVKEEFFINSVLGWFFRLVTKHFDNYRAPINSLTVRNEILKFPPEDRPKYEIAFDKIEASQYTDEQYLREELTGWIRSRKFIKLHKDMEVLYNANKRDSAYDVTDKAIQELKQIDFSEDRVIQFDNLDIVLDEIARANANRIRLGIPYLDDALGGGLRRQGLTTILGGTNVGKSIMLVNIAYNAVKQDKKVLYIYHEGADDQMLVRMLSRFSGIAFKKFYGGLMNMTSEERSRLELTKTLLSEHLVLKPWQRFGTTVDEVVAYCRQKKADFPFDLIIDDYGQLLFVKNPDKETRHNQAMVYRGLGILAAELNVALVTAAQGTRISQVESDKGKKLLSMTDIAECFEISRCSECVITLTKSAEDNENSRIKILLSKQRDGKTNLAVDCRTDLERLVMYDENLGMVPVRLSQSQEVMEDEDEGSLVAGPSNLHFSPVAA